MRVAVIGAGIVGASVAFRLAESRAVRVWIIDGSGPANGTTSTSFAWVNANDKTPRDYFELNRAGLEEHLRLCAELPGGTPWIHPGGNLEWAGDEETLEALTNRVERLRSWGYAAEWRKARHVNEALEPNVAFPSPDTPVAFFSEEVWIDAAWLTNTFGLACQRGAEARFGVAVKEIETDGGRASALLLQDGERLPVDAVVNAAGPEADKVAALLGRTLPLRPKEGLLVRLAAEVTPINRIVHSPRVHLRPMDQEVLSRTTVRLTRSSKTRVHRVSSSPASCWSVPGGWSQRSKVRRPRTSGSVFARCPKTACPVWERSRSYPATTRPSPTAA